MLEQHQLHALEARCTQEAAPRCRVACPLDMDVRAFVENMAAGTPREARKLLERHLPLPAILTAVCDHPCEQACLRRDYGGGLAVGALEQVCMAAVPEQTRALVRAPKAERLAVLGAGLAGLTAAFDISRKGFPVTVYHEGASEDALRAAFPEVPEAALAAEWAALGKHHVRFAQAALTQALLAQAEEECAAVLVDAAVCAFAPARAGVDAATLLWRDKVCCCGWPASTPTGAQYASASAQAGEGRRAGITLQRIMTGVSLVAARENEDRTDRLHTPLDGVTALPRIVPASGIFTPEEARAEADRCLRCSCMQCVKECVFLKKYKEFPRLYARKIYNNATVVRGTRTANVLVNGCALCGQCEEICPERFSMAELCLEARRDLVARDVMPASAHEFALEDMAQASGPDCAFYLEDPDMAQKSCCTGAGEHAAQMFFPGCQLAASRGGQVLAMYRWLRGALSRGLSLYSTCCGIPAHWAGREALFAEHAAELRRTWEAGGKPKIIVACSSCLEALRLALPEADMISLWEVLDGLMPEAFSSAAPAVMSVQDPCGARHDAGWRQAVRSLARKAGIAVQEPRRSGAESACCGYGGLVWNAQPDVADAMTAARAADFPHSVLSSCIMCRDRFADGGESWHMFDILPMTAAAGVPAAGNPGISARRAGRAALKDAVRREFWHEAVSAPAEAVRLHLTPEVLRALERRYILRQDVLEAVAGVEQTGGKFLNRADGHWLGSWRPRNVTFWVEYTAEADGSFTLHDAWCHRMVVPGAVQPATEVILPDRVHA